MTRERIRLSLCEVFVRMSNKKNTEALSIQTWNARDVQILLARDDARTMAQILNHFATTGQIPRLTTTVAE